MNNDLFVPLEKVISKRHINDNKYVLYDAVNDDKYVKKVINNSTYLDIVLEDETVVKVECSPANAIRMQNQLYEIVKLNNNITIGELKRILLVPKNKKYEEVRPILITEITNKSDIPITLNGIMTNLKNGSETVFNEKFSLNTIRKGDTELVKNNIASGYLDKGLYNVSAPVKTRDVEKKISYMFRVGDIRNLVLVMTVGVLAIIYVFEILIIYFILKCIFKRKNKNLNEFDDNDKDVDDDLKEEINKK